MLHDLTYCKTQILFARAANARMQTNAVDNALERALDAIERLQEAAARPADAELDAIFAGDEPSFEDVR